MASSNRRRPHAPSEFPPPVKPVEEFVKRGLDDEDELIEVGVAIVGGGTAGLACANRLMRQLRASSIKGITLIARCFEWQVV